MCPPFSHTSHNTHTQIFTKIGAVNIPQWYEAGKVYISGDGAIPFGACAYALCASHAVVRFKQDKCITNVSLDG